MTDPTELDALVAPLRASFHAKRRDVAAKCEAISRLVDSYLASVDARITSELSRTHSLPSKAPSTDPGQIAQELLRCVQQLPELLSRTGAEAQVDTPKDELTGPKRREPTTSTRAAEGATAARGTAPEVTPAPPLACLRQATQTHPLVVVGGPPHLERLASLALGDAHTIEWVDTTRQGTHAIGNLERRIRDRRITALLILEGLVQHKHSDPLVSTARVTNVPVVYGGKGGRSALLQSLVELEGMLQQRK